MHIGAGELRGPLHGDDRQDLEQVVLHHVLERAARVVIAAARADPLLLEGGNLHRFDEPRVPEIGKDGVGKADGLDVADHLLAEVVVDAVDVFGVEEGLQPAVELPSGREAFAERLFEDDLAPARAAHRGEPSAITPKKRGATAR